MRGAEALRLGVASRPLDQIEHWPPILAFVYAHTTRVKLRFDVNMYSCW